MQLGGHTRAMYPIDVPKFMRYHLVGVNASDPVRPYMPGRFRRLVNRVRWGQVSAGSPKTGNSVASAKPTISAIAPCATSKTMIP
jgi:hypothetical protein